MANSTPEKNKHSIVSRSYNNIEEKDELKRIDGRVVSVKDFL